MSTHWTAAATPGLGAHDLHIWRATVAAPPATLAACAARLSDDEAARAARFVYARDRNRFIVARALLRTLLATYLDTAPGALRFGYAAQGKPFVLEPRGAQPLEFNLAHSGDLILLAFAWARRVGVDVEFMRAALDYRALAHSVFAPSELEALATLPEEPGRRAFFAAWTRKEAFVKALGTGLSHPLDSFSVSLLPQETPRLHLPTAAESARWTLSSLDAHPDYAAAVVHENVGGAAATLHCFAARLPGA